MINDISWASYCFAISILLAFYYTTVLLIYYKDEIAHRVFRRNASVVTHQSSGGLYAYQAPVDLLIDRAGYGHTGAPVRQDNNVHINSALLDELQAYFQQVAGMQVNKNELMLSLQQLLAKYKMNVHHGQRSLINQIIQMHCIKDCSTHLDDEEVDLLWRD